MRRFPAILSALALAALCAPAAAADLAVVGARLYPTPTAAAIARATVVVHDGKISAVGAAGTVKVPRGARVIDGRGLVVTAGFWNSHVHLMTPVLLDAVTKPDAEVAAELKAVFTRWGFTTVYETAGRLDTTLDVRRRIASGAIAGPDILTVGDAFYPKGGTPIYVRRLLEAHHFPSGEVESIPSAVARLDDQARRGSNGVKIFAGAIVGGKIGVLPMRRDVARALVAEAHRLGQPVFAHPSNTEGVEISMDSGVDVLAHTAPMSGPWSPALVERIKAHKMALIPTLTLFEVEARKSGESPEDSAKDMQAALQQLKAYSDAGGQILFGTDVGYTDAYDTTEEYRLMGQVMGYRQILAALTVNPAMRFGFAARRGKLARGFDGDLTVLAADPAADVTAFAKVRYTIRQGAVIYVAP